LFESPKAHFYHKLCFHIVLPSFTSINLAIFYPISQYLAIICGSILTQACFPPPKKDCRRKTKGLVNYPFNYIYNLDLSVLSCHQWRFDSIPFQGGGDRDSLNPEARSS